MTTSEKTTNKRTGILLINLGSPASPRTKHVRSYLRQFLSNPRVIDIHPITRSLLLNCIILPFRSPRSAQAYQQIWTDEGSPLLVHSANLHESLHATLTEEEKKRVHIVMAMSCGRPSIPEALGAFQKAGVTKIKVLPLYPQYSSATVGGVLDAVYRELAKHWNVPRIEVLPVFYDFPGYIAACAEIAQSSMRRYASEKNIQFDHTLFSFHSLPKRQIKKSDTTGDCLTENCCAIAIQKRKIPDYCYRAQCFETARLLAENLRLKPADWSVSFQSRLRGAPWMGPFTDVLLGEFPKRGVKNLAIMAPSFVADCLETLEELSIRGREQFLSQGGEHFLYVPCPNDHPVWVKAVADMVFS